MEEMKYIALILRRNRLLRNGKNVKTPGVLRKLNRQIRNLEPFKF